ncbi:MAG: HD domain-containing protein [bacterium]|nr:HD domain-containing protein [bacterium]
MAGNYADLATLLARGISQRRMYFDGHPNVKQCATEFVDLLGRLLAEEEVSSFLLGVVEGKLVHDGRYLVGSTVVGRQLTSFAELLEAGGYEIDARIEASELVRFFTLAAETEEAPGGLEASRQLLAANGIGLINLSPPYRNYGTSQESIDLADETHSDIETLLAVYQAMFSTVEHAHMHAAMSRDLQIDEARSVGESLVKVSRTGSTDIMNLVNYPDCDTYTVGHSVRVAMLSILVGRAAGLEENLLCELGAAGLLHDVGKGKIPQEVLFKPGRLDAEERLIIETHPEEGARMLLDSNDATPLAVAIAWGHHRRYDGGGYPKMPHGDRTSELTQLVHTCDVFEALTAIRPYKRAMTPRHAYEIMLKDRDAYSPAAMHALVKAVGLYPPGQKVVLSDGTAGIIMAAGDDIERPRVKITHDEDGALLGQDAMLAVDLAEEEAPAVAKLLLGA